MLSLPLDSDSRLEVTGRTDLEELASEQQRLQDEFDCLEMIPQENVLGQDNIEALNLSSSQQKKTTGRFNTGLLISSEKSGRGKKKHSRVPTNQNEGGMEERYLSTKQALKVFQEDDSIIKILPGLPSGLAGTAEAQALDEGNDSQLNQLSDHGHAAAVGLTTAFGAESLIAPVGVQDDSKRLDIQKIYSDSAESPSAHQQFSSPGPAGGCGPSPI